MDFVKGLPFGPARIGRLKFFDAISSAARAWATNMVQNGIASSYSVPELQPAETLWSVVVKPKKAPRKPGRSQNSTGLSLISASGSNLGRLNRLQIQPSLGASTYYFGSEALQTIPQGENAPLT
jgi:hypothetical protein